MLNPGQLHNYLRQEADFAAVRYQHQRADMRFTELERAMGLYGFHLWAIHRLRLDYSKRRTFVSYPPGEIMSLLAPRLLIPLADSGFAEAANRFGYNFQPHVELPALEVDKRDPTHLHSFSRAVLILGTGLVEQALEQVESPHPDALEMVLEEPEGVVQEETLHQILADAWEFEKVMARERTAGPVWRAHFGDI